MVMCVPVMSDGQIDPRWGRAARVASFLREQGVQVVVAHHIGPGMATMLGRMGLTVRLGASGDARQAALAAAASSIRRGLGQHTRRRAPLDSASHFPRKRMPVVLGQDTPRPPLRLRSRGRPAPPSHPCCPAAPPSVERPHRQ